MFRRALTLLTVALLAGCASVAPVPSDAVTVRLIAFNDFHGNLESASLGLPWPDPDQSGKARRLAAGGAAWLAGTVQALRDGARHSVVLHSGDLIGATPLVSALFRHESTIDIVNRLGLDIATPGNHEFDAGRDELLRVLRGGCAAARQGDLTVSCPFGRHDGARFAVFSANVLQADGSPLFPPSVVLERGGVRIGFIGAVTRSTPSIVVPSGVAGLRFVDEADAINAEARRLQDQGVRALVAVIHEGGDTGTPGQPLEWNDAACPNPRGPIFEIVRRLDPGIDLIFSAHTHQGYRCVIDGRPVMQATALGRGVSVADVVIESSTGEIDRARTMHRNLPVLNAGSDARLRAHILASEPAPWSDALGRARGSQAIAQRVAEYAAAAAPTAQRSVGRIGGSFDRDGSTDSAAGRLIADAQYRATRAADRGSAQFALMNPGGVRSDLLCRTTPPCSVAYGDVFTMQPFGNSLVVMTLTAAQFKQLLEDQQPPGRSRALFLVPSSTLTYRWKSRAPYGERVQDIRIGGEPLDPSRDVRFAVNSFLAEGGDGFAILRQGRDRLGGELDLEALIAHLALTPSPDPTPRITALD